MNNLAILERALSWWGELSQERKGVMLELANKIGVDQLLSMHEFLEAAKVGAWDIAEMHLRDRLWYYRTDVFDESLCLLLRRKDCQRKLNAA